MNGDPVLVARLLGGMAVTLAFAALLSRGLGRKLRVEVGIASIALPAALLLPWLASDRILLPTADLARAIPGTGIPFAASAHSLVLNDVSLQLAPWELEVRRQLADGRLPLWSDRIDGGSSPWANPQASVVAPTAMLARLLPARHHFLAALVFKIQLALCGTWVAARLLGSGRRSALAAAAGFAVGGGVLVWGLFPIASVMAWAPWCVAAALRIARRPSAQSWAVAIVAVGFLMVSGHPESAFGASALTAGVAASYGRRGQRARAVARLAVAGALAFGLAAPALVPFLASVGESQRAFDRRIERERFRSGDEPARVRPWSRTDEARILVAPLSPLAAGIPFESAARATNLHAHSGYAGLVVLAGAALAAASAGARRRALPVVVAAIVIYAIASRLPGLAWVWDAVPLLQVQEPSRLAPLATLALALAGALGLDAALRRPRAIGAWRRAAIAGAFPATGFAIAPDLGVAIVGAGIALAALVAARAPRSALLLIGLALLGDQIPWGRRLLPFGDARLFFPATTDVARIVTTAGGPGGRVVGHEKLAYPATLSSYGLSDPRTHNPLASAAYHRVLDAAFGFRPSVRTYFAAFRHLEHPLLDFLGVRAVISSPHFAEIPGMRRDPLSDPRLSLAVNRDALPRTFVTSSFDRVRSADLAGWIAAMSDPRRIALDPDEVAARVPEGGLREGRARLVEDGDHRRTVEVAGRGFRLLATSWRGPAGWRARAGDGRVLETLTVNGAFLGVVVPPNVRRVELVFRPPGLGIGLLLAGASLAAVGTAALIGGIRRRSAAAQLRRTAAG